VIEANVLGVRVNSKAPALEQFTKLDSVGEGEGQQMAALRRQYPQALVLSFGQP
jgi:hypothetical protein